MHRVDLRIDAMAGKTPATGVMGLGLRGGDGAVGGNRANWRGGLAILRITTTVRPGIKGTVHRR